MNETRIITPDPHLARDFEAIDRLRAALEVTDDLPVPMAETPPAPDSERTTWAEWAEDVVKARRETEAAAQRIAAEAPTAPRKLRWTVWLAVLLWVVGTAVLALCAVLTWPEPLVPLAMFGWAVCGGTISAAAIASDRAANR